MAYHQTEFRLKKLFMASEDIISLTEFKSDASGWLERLQSRPPVVLTQNGRGRAVVQSYEGYQHAQFQLALLMRLNRALADVPAGRTKSQEQVFADARTRLKKRLAKGG